VSSLVAVCFYWIDPARNRQYQITPDDVRIWNRMVARHLPHARRVCVTHRPDLIDFMPTVPLDMAKHVPGLCTVKLMVWRPDIASIIGGERILLMDVDCVITGDMEPLVDRPEDCVFWKNPNFTEGGKRGFYQGSMQLLTAGARPQLWEDFNPLSTPAMLNRRFGGGEQAWISERLNLDYPAPGWRWDEAHWTESDGVYGAGRLMGGKMGAGVQSELPENARVVFTPGDRSPSQPEMQALHPWIAAHWN
jgi:hypothetical protein